MGSESDVQWSAPAAHAVAFFKGFLRHPRIVGSVIPSSRFLAQRILRLARLHSARTIVELGPGTGPITRAMLAVMTPHARLLCIEIDDAFASALRREPDPRLVVHHGSALELSDALREPALPAPDVVVSGIPFSTMPAEMGRRILEQVWQTLAPGGRFIAYQFRGEVARLGREVMGLPAVSTELRNVPPIRIYSWTKPDGSDDRRRESA